VVKKSIASSMKRSGLYVSIITVTVFLAMHQVITNPTIQNPGIIVIATTIWANSAG
jgi:hypothetical protein